MSYNNPFPDGDGEHPFPFSDGDPYRETDEVYRGITMASLPTEDCHPEPDFVLGSMSLLPPEPHAFKGFMDGDSHPTLKGFMDGHAYHEPDTFLKGMCINEMDDELPPMPVAMPGYLEGAGAFGAAKDGHFDAQAFEKFTEAHHPPDVPTDQLFKLQLTTVHLTTTTPHQLGNHLLEFLGGESKSSVKASILKVRHAKFAIKADVFSGSSKCTLKARVYREEFAKYAIEFQRRSGDCVTFNKAYKEAARRLELHFAAGGDPEAALGAPADLGPHPPPLGVEEFSTKEGMDGAQSLHPLFDMAGRVDQPSLQAEAAAALANAAMQDAASLCTRETSELSKDLLHAGCAGICYHIARMLSSLAQCPEAAEWFRQDQALLQIIQMVMESQATSALVQQQLAQVWSKFGGSVL